MLIMTLSYTQKSNDLSLIKTYVSHPFSRLDFSLTRAVHSSTCSTSGRSS